MDREKYLEELEKQIETVKKNAIEEIKKEQMVPAMWSVSCLIDLKAQVSAIKKISSED